MSYGTDYLDIPELNRKAVGRVKKPMANKPEVKTENVKTKKYAKTRGEHAKDILIAMLVTGIIAFIGGMHFSNSQHSQITSAVKAAVTPSASAQSVAPASK